jgi:hypothetical protein
MAKILSIYKSEEEEEDKLINRQIPLIIDNSLTVREKERIIFKINYLFILIIR